MAGGDDVESQAGGSGPWACPTMPWRQQQVAANRVVRFPPPAHAHTRERQHYCGNKTTTTKYSLLTFIPKSLFEQYRRVANIYFTLVAALSLTPYSPVRPWTTFLPLVIVLGVAMIKEAVEDYKRHRQDVEVNNRKVQVYSHAAGGFVTRTWRDVSVGDVIIVHKDEYFPADVLFLTAENAEGICYIETMNLDGETNLKIKKAPDQTKWLRQDSIGGLSCVVTCEPPNSRLYQFTGNYEQPAVRPAGGGSVSSGAGDGVCEASSGGRISVGGGGGLSTVGGRRCGSSGGGGSMIERSGGGSGGDCEAGGGGGGMTATSLSTGAILLRGCSLRNTARVFGLVIYAGHDTKIFMNATQPPSKRSSIERKVDHIILFMFGLLFSMCLTGCIYFAWWTARYMPAHWYLAPAGDEVPREYDGSRPGIVAVTNFITSFILYGYLIPIALYVSIEMVKVLQSFVFIGLDRDMYHAETNTPAVARTSNLNEELGRVNTILSDKTGTLTRNVMEFFKCSIGGVAYGAGVTEIERSNAERRGLQLDVADEEGDNKYREPYFNFYDGRLMGTAWAGQPNPELTTAFFRLLALCHTVIPDGPPLPDQIRYEAESPDEAALVVAAKVFGFMMVRRTNTTITLRERLPEGVRETEYEVLNILEFNSTRKRMSIVIRTPDNRIILYCKGADTVIYERLDKGHPLNGSLRDVTLSHMEEFGSAGLRTLCLAYKELDPTVYDEWNERFIVAKLSLEDRAAKVEEVGGQIEWGLTLLGCTAIEDKLQEGVPGCIKTLAQAGIRLWVLTGDKMETAINIGYACSLITDDMTQFQLTGSSEEVEALEAAGQMEAAMAVSAERLESQLLKVQRTIDEDAAAGIAMGYALIIDGKALLYALSPRLRQLFLQVGIKCAAVLCCRVSPLQKAQVTALVKSWGDTTLAIGDGANDVGMIQKAHIGVGISGQEGMQAAMAADFAIAQFRFLTPLLLVHGRLSYKRITRMISFFFYKNLFYGSTIFVYNAFALFSGQPIYNDFYMTLFNVVFTAAAPLVVGWFDRDLEKQYSMRFPFLYREGQQNLYFGLPAIVGWLGTALLHAALVVVMVMTGADGLDSDRSSGLPWSLQQNGVLMFSIVIITVHLQLAMIIDSWMWMHHVAIWGSIVLWFLFLVAYGAFPVKLSTDLYLIMNVVGGSPSFWLMVAVVPLTCLLPVFFVRALRRQLRPAAYQLVQEIAVREARGEAVATDAAFDAAFGASAHLKGIMARASRLVQRKVLRGQQPSGVGGRGRHKGFVPPYNTASRVFDVNELRSAATQAGYSINASGDVTASQRLPSHLGGPSMPYHRSSTGSGVMNALAHFSARHSLGAPSHSGTAAAPPGSGSGHGGMQRASLAPGSASGGDGMLRTPLAGGSSAAAAGDAQLGGGGGDAAPGLLECAAANPVLAGLELANSVDPRRHRRNDSHLSNLSISSLHRMLRPSSTGSESPHSSDAGSGSPEGSTTSAAAAAAATLPGTLEAQPGRGGSSSSPHQLEQQARGSGAAGGSRGGGGQHVGGTERHAASLAAGQPQQPRMSRLGLPHTPTSPAAGAAAAAAAPGHEAAGAAAAAAAGDNAAAGGGGHNDPAMLELYTSALRRRQQHQQQQGPGRE